MEPTTSRSDDEREALRTEEQIRARLSNIRQYYDATWASRELAAPSASELIWVLTGEEAWGEAYLEREYELPSGSQVEWCVPCGEDHADPCVPESVRFARAKGEQ